MDVPFVKVLQKPDDTGAHLAVANAANIMMTYAQYKTEQR